MTWVIWVFTVRSIFSLSWSHEKKGLILGKVLTLSCSIKALSPSGSPQSILFNKQSDKQVDNCAVIQSLRKATLAVVLFLYLCCVSIKKKKKKVCRRNTFISILSENVAPDSEKTEAVNILAIRGPSATRSHCFYFTDCQRRHCNTIIYGQNEIYTPGLLWGTMQVSLSHSPHKLKCCQCQEWFCVLCHYL